MLNKIKVIVIIITCLIFTQSCNSYKENKLSKKSRTVYNLLNNSISLKDVLVIADTISLISKNGTIYDVNPILLASKKYYFIINPLFKFIAIFDNEGNFISNFGRDGDGPGEFRNIQSACLDNNNNIIIYDNILSRITAYSYIGKILYQQNIDIPNQYIRHLSISDASLYFHHVPIAEFQGFVSKIKNGVYVRSYITKISGYDNYYNRGFLDGDLINDENGNIYETDCYDITIKKIVKNKIYRFENIEQFGALRKTRYQDYDKLVISYQKSTIPLKLFLLDSNSIILQEVINFSNDRKKVNKSAIFYDTSGVYLGSVLFDKELSFNTSDNVYLLKFVDPSLYPPEVVRNKYPFIVKYKIKHEPN